MKTQMYLTPSQVEELKDLGVEFEETEHSQIKVGWGNVVHGIIRADPANEWDMTFTCFLGLDGYKGLETLPAPSLQEMLEKLPKTIECDNHLADYFLRIEWGLDTEVCYMYYDHENMYEKEVKNGSFSVSNSNPLFAAFELLKWVAKHHPESLTDKTE